MTTMTSGSFRPSSFQEAYALHFDELDTVHRMLGLLWSNNAAFGGRIDASLCNAWTSPPRNARGPCLVLGLKYPSHQRIYLCNDPMHLTTPDLRPPRVLVKHHLPYPISRNGSDAVTLLDPQPPVLPYDRGNRWLPFLGLIGTCIAGIAFVALGAGIMILSQSPVYQTEEFLELLQSMNVTESIKDQKIIVINVDKNVRTGVNLGLAVVVTLCIEATGYVHGTALKWSLAEEGRLHFNANLRLFRSIRGSRSNSWPINILHSLALILAYASSTMIILPIHTWETGINSETEGELRYTVGSFLPPMVLGGALLVQAMLGFYVLTRTSIHTWESHPLTVTAAAVHHRLVFHVEDRCMRSVADCKNPINAPTPPSPKQPPSLCSHKAITGILWLIWAFCPLWFIAGFSVHQFMGTYVDWFYVGAKAADAKDIGFALLVVSAVQTPMTLALHCCELITILNRDEKLWREASSRGARLDRHPLWIALSSWESLFLMIAKIVLHWIFGLGVVVAASGGVSIFSLGLFGLSIGMFFTASVITFVALRHPKGPQPAAYGHIQTLANLVDDWTTTINPKSTTRIMFWGDKSSGPTAHSGTSTTRLPPVQMYLPYL